jgi:hypothetical protein
MRDKFQPDFDRKISPPPNMKVQRAKAVILNGVKLTLKKCAGCKDEFYGTEMQTRCENCLAKKRKRA